MTNLDNEGPKARTARYFFRELTKAFTAKQRDIDHASASGHEYTGEIGLTCFLPVIGILTIVGAGAGYLAETFLHVPYATAGGAALGAAAFPTAVILTA